MEKKTRFVVTLLGKVVTKPFSEFAVGEFMYTGDNLVIKTGPTNTILFSESSAFGVNNRVEPTYLYGVPSAVTITFEK